MRKSVLFILVSLAFSTMVTNMSSAQEYVPNQIVVTMKSSLRPERIGSCGTRMERSLILTLERKIYLLSIFDGRSIENVIRCLKQLPEIKFAEPNYIIKPMK